MSSPAAARAARFRALHIPGEPLLLPNPADAGIARVLASLGFAALATTSGGFAATLGRLDGSVTRDEALAHAAAIVAATDIPVSADLENGFGHAADEVAATVRAAVDTGLAGCSVEDHTGSPTDPIYDPAHAAERIEAAAEAAHAGPVRLVLTARAENYLHGRRDLADTISRLQLFEAAGADVLYAPGLTELNEIAELVSSVSVPVNVLALPTGPSVADLARVGVARISLGSALSNVALASVAAAAREFLAGDLSFLAGARDGRAVAAAAFTS